MIRTVLSGLLLVAISAPPGICQTPAAAPIRKDLQQKHEEYLSLNRQIYMRHEDPESERIHVSDPGRAPSMEVRLRDIIRQGVLENAPGANPDDVKAAINYVQGELSFQAERPAETNLPLAQFSQLNGSQTLSVAYIVLQGGDVIPDTQPYLDFYAKGLAGWSLQASTGSEFRGCTLFVARMNAGLAGENWYLAWGKRIGATGSYLKIRLYGFDGSK